MNVTVPVYQRKRNGSLDWATVGLGAFGKRRHGTQSAKLQQQIVDELRRAIETAAPKDLLAFDLERGTHLRRVRVELDIQSKDEDEKKRRVSGIVPLIVEPRHAGNDRVLTIAYHPHRQEEWFPVDPLGSLEEQASTWFGKAWASLSTSDVEALWSDGKDLLRVLAFSASPRSLLDAIAGKRKGLWDDLNADPTQKDKPRAGGTMKVLPNLGTDHTARRSTGDAPAITARSPYREQLQMLLGGDSGRRSTILVGPSGVGKTTLLLQLIDDLLILDDYPSHRNLDKVGHVWEIAGKRIIAGMSYVGDWEQRVSELIDDATLEKGGKRAILYIPDLHAFGRIGQARDSTRSLADVLRGPVARGDVTIVSEATEEQLARLEQDAPTFASLFARVHVREATAEDSFRMLLSAARAIEAESELTFEPLSLRTLLELGSALLSQRALPGRALELLRAVTDDAIARSQNAQTVSPFSVMRYLTERTGLPQQLLDPSKPLAHEAVARELSARVIGQESSVRQVTDLVLKVRAGVVDPKRPYGVLLFTGPTGTGKTELAKALAKYLYGSESRLLRFDMGEYGGWDAPSRLIGDRYAPEGLLTRAVHEQPFCVVLFDEVEKAHPSVLNLFLQLFDEGRLTDAGGSTASFMHTVIVMTSNLGARPRAPVGFGESSDAVMKDVARAVREFFPPELFNRIDAVVPFAPLTHEVAIEVAEKELAKLLGRRGVASRHIFVQANRAVVERIAAQAFEQRDGARSLKRFLEDRVGSLIGEEIAKAPNVALRVLHLLARADASAPFRVEQEALVEATPIDLRSTLEPLLDVTADALLGHVQALVPELDGIEQSPELATLADRIHAALVAIERGRLAHEEADAVYRLDGLRAMVRGIRDRVEALLITSRELEHHAIERKHFSHEVLETGSKFSWSRRRLRVLSGSEAGPDPRARTQRALLGLLAEVAFLRRALSAARDPTRHAVMVELIPLSPGTPHGPGLLDPLLHAYLEVLAPSGGQKRGEIDGWAIVHENGEIEAGDERVPLQLAVARARQAVGRHAVQIVFRAVGLCLFDLYELETGTHVYRDGTQAPALVRVRALKTDPGITARSLAEEHARARAAHRVAIDAPPVAPLLPVVRTIHRAVHPETRGGPSPWAIEDYAVAYVDTVWSRSLADALDPLWLLKLSREASS